jgi:hypothetical protein
MLLLESAAVGYHLLLPWQGHYGSHSIKDAIDQFVKVVHR